MARLGICSGFYTAQSVNADAQRSVNRYPEILDEDSKSRALLCPSPGTKLFCTLPDAPGRGNFTFRGRKFAVSGATLFEIYSDGEFIARGQVGNDNLAVGLAANVNQLAIVSAGQLYILTLATNVLSGPIAVPSAPLIGIALYADAYFAAASSSEIQFSALLDGTTWPGLQAEAPSVFPDDIIGIEVDHREIFVGSRNACQGYYNSGSLNIFDVIPGGFIEQGLAGAHAKAKLDNTVFAWVTNENNAGGGPIAYRFDGYQPRRVSTHAIEYAVQNYPKWSDVICYAFQEFGHTFFHSYFPSANGGLGASWRYDVSTNKWHEVDFTDPVTGKHMAHRSMSHVFAFNQHLVLDWKSGMVLQMSSSLYDDFGNPMHRVRRVPHVANEQEWIFHHSLQIDYEMGLGPEPPLANVPTAVLVPDEGVGVWAVTLNDDFSGPVWTPSGAGLAQVLILNDTSLVNTSWQVTVQHVNGQPLLTAVGVAFQNAPSSIVIGNLSGTMSALLSISGGRFQTGQAISTARDPQCVIRWSDDGGHTFGHDRIVNLGQAGQFRKRAIIRRLGRSRDRVYEISDSDPIPSRIVDAYLKATPGYQPTERLSSQIRKGA